MTHPCTVTYVDVQKCAKIVQHHTLHSCVEICGEIIIPRPGEIPARSTSVGEVVVTVICSSLYTSQYCALLMCVCTAEIMCIYKVYSMTQHQCMI